MILSGKKTLDRFFLKRVQLSPRKNAIGYIKNGVLKFITYKEYKKTVEAYSFGLNKIDLLKQNKVAIISHSSHQWHFLDISIMCLGGIVIPIRPGVPQMEYIMEHSECSILIVENDKILDSVKKLSKYPFHLKTIVIINTKKNTSNQSSSQMKIISLKNLLQSISNLNHSHIIQHHRNEIREDDIASMIYADEISNRPKGVIITHRAIVTMLNNTSISMEKALGPDDRSLLFTCLSEIKGRCHSLCLFPLGMEIVYPEKTKISFKNITAVNPTVIMGSPDILKKIYTHTINKINNDSTIENKIFKWAIEVSNKYYFKIECDLSPTTREILEKTIAYKTFFSKIYKKFGGEVRFFISDGKPIPSEIIRFFRHANLIILEGHGITETVGFFTINPPGKQIPETAGLPIGDTRLKMAKNGKIHIKTKALFASYYKNPESTTEAFIDGYFCSKISGKIMSNGYLKVIEDK